MTFSGEQGQTIRQLIGAHVLRRIAMCCLASPKGRRQHLAVSHEKGKVCVDICAVVCEINIKIILGNMCHTMQMP